MSWDNHTKWLASLKAGDKAVIPGRWDAGRIVTVERLTATQIIIASGERFNRKTGSAIGRTDRFYSLSLREPTSDLMEQVEQRQLADWLGGIASSRRELPLATLRAMKAAYEANKPEA